MKSILKRIFVTLLTLLLLFSIAGCGQQGTIPSTTDTSTLNLLKKFDNKDGTKNRLKYSLAQSIAGAGQIDVLNELFAKFERQSGYKSQRAFWNGRH